MSPSLLFLLVLLAAEWNTWILAYAMIIGLVDAGLLSVAAVCVWVRLGFGD